MAQPHKIELKTISSSGQISLGKAHAGKHIQLEQLEDGRWIITPVQVIPEHLKWAHTPEVTARLKHYLAWKTTMQPQETDLDTFEKELVS
jgi:hypothetical protein